MSRVPIHDHTNIHQGGKIRGASITGVGVIGDLGGPGGETGVTDHGGLSGLADDDHSAYLTVTAGGGDTIKAHGSAGATETIDPADGNVHTLTLDANCTITLTPPTSGVNCDIRLHLTQDGTGSRLVTWPASVAWPAATAPTLSTTAAAIDTVTLSTLDGGTNWYGLYAGAVSSLTVKDEGVSLATGATSIDFVGAGVVASGTGAAKTVTIAGTTTRILLADGHATPFVFTDLLQRDDGTDFLYADPE